MKRLYIICEGQTEERFVNDVLAPHLQKFNVHAVARCWGKRGQKGGGNSYDRVQNDIEKWIAQEGHDKNVYFTVMIDLYGFPKQGRSVYDEEIENTPEKSQKIEKLEQKMLARVNNFYRFIPYIQLHEFEALLFSNLDVLKQYFVQKEKEINKLATETKGLMPEEINETPDGAPSKRLDKYLGYAKQKTSAGPLIAGVIGIEEIKNECPNFKKWVTKLENISTNK
jgi:hypothetical protein